MSGVPPSPPPGQPRLLDRVREAIRARHYSRRTEKAYVHWIKRYIFFHGKRHPAEMGVAPDTLRRHAAYHGDARPAASAHCRKEERPLLAALRASVLNWSMPAYNAVQVTSR